MRLFRHRHGGGKANLVVVVRKRNGEDALIMQVPPLGVAEQDKEQTKRHLVIVKSIEVAGAIVSGALSALAFSPTGAGAVVAGLMAGAYAEREMRGVISHLAPDVVESAGRRQDTFYAASNWIGIFRWGEPIRVFGRASLGSQRGVVFCDTQNWKGGGIYVSGDVGAVLSDIEFFVRRCGAPFICHNPATGEVWLVKRLNTVSGVGHQIGKKRVAVVEIGAGPVMTSTPDAT